MNTVYIDVLFGFNFAVDYILLLITARLSGIKTNRARIIAAAAVGGIYAVFVYFPQASLLYSGLFKIAATVIICIIAFGCGSIKGIIRNSLTFFMCSLVLAGTALFFYYASGGTVRLKNGVPYVQMSFKTFVISGAICYVLLSVIFRARAKDKSGKEIIKLTVCGNGKKLSVSALVDTGCSLTEPIGGKPVMICDISSASGLFDGEALKILSAYGRSSPAECIAKMSEICDVRKFKLVPYRTAGSENGIMLAFRPDSIEKRNGQKIDALIGISNSEISGENGYTALIGVV